MKNLTNLFNKLSSLLFPPKCPACHEIGVNSAGLCSSCFEKYTRELDALCPVCGKKALDCVCETSRYSSSFLGDRRALTLTFYNGYYGGGNRITEKLIYSYKRNYNKSLVDLFARDISFHLIKLFKNENEKAEDWIITYPPRSDKNVRKYGFDHAEKAVERISYFTGIPHDKLILRIGGAEQKSLDSEKRAKNARDSMIVSYKKNIEGKRIILFDDVITTGSTMRSAADLLFDAGAKIVFPVSIAKTFPR